MSATCLPSPRTPRSAIAYTKLDRDVALKVLPQAFTDDPDRLARFEREAKVLASLNHPNIGHIHGLEEAEGPGPVSRRAMDRVVGILLSG